MLKLCLVGVVTFVILWEVLSRLTATWMRMSIPLSGWFKKVRQSDISAWRQVIASWKKLWTDYIKKRNQTALKLKPTIIWMILAKIFRSNTRAAPQTNLRFFSALQNSFSAQNLSPCHKCFRRWKQFLVVKFPSVLNLKKNTCINRHTSLRVTNTRTKESSYAGVLKTERSTIRDTNMTVWQN